MGHRRSVPDSVQKQVRQRANYLCEYCHTPEQWQYVPFTVDHVLPLARGGTDDMDNLALACFHCNRRKINLTMAADPHTEEPAPLFNRRQNAWAEHFIWSADALQVVGLTPTGRATFEQLNLNRDRVLRLRAADLIVDRHPPKGDPIRHQDE